MVLPAAAVYAVLFSLVGWQAAALSAVLYLFAPYHAVQIYVRGAVGEYWELLFWPLILYALVWNGVRGRERRAMVAGAVGLFGSILSHTLLGYATTVFLGIGLAIYWLVRVFRRDAAKKEYTAHLRWILLGLGMASFFWLPALSEMRFTDVAAQVSATANYADHFVCMVQLWSSAWGFGGSAPGCLNDGLSFMIGKIHIILALVAILAWMTGALKKINRRFLFVAFLSTVIGIFLTLQFSLEVWRILPMFAYLQYPWRFLALALFGLAALSGVVVTLIRHPLWRTVVTIGAIAAVIGMNTKWFVPQYLYTPASGSFESSRDIRWRASKISDEYLPKAIVRPVTESHVVSDTIESRQPISVTPISATAVENQSVVESTSSALVRINIAYFPGWKYYINGTEVRPGITAGLPTLEIGPGQSVITAKFTDTPVRILGNIISGVSFVLLLYIYVKQRKTKG